jgi:hypothetical protein
VTLAFLFVPGVRAADGAPAVDVDPPAPALAAVVAA